MPGAGQNYCTYTMKALALACGIAGIVCSWAASNTCDFITFQDNDGNPPDRAEDPPFNRAISASVGIFKYEILEFADGTRPTDCQAYDDRWIQGTYSYPSLTSAQFCALLAPLCAILGLFLNTVDFCVCNFPGSFMFASTLMLAASGIQAGTFTLIADPVFCFEDDDLDCSSGKGVTLSAVATVLFFVTACFMCCAPRADPFCFRFGQDSRDSPSSRKQKPGHNKTVVVQPIIIESSKKKGDKNSRNEDQQQKKPPSSTHRPNSSNNSH